MHGTTKTAGEGESVGFLMEVEGELGQEWAPWFHADSIKADHGRTVLAFTVADQSELHGLLRRVHDLHLRLVSLTRTES